MAELSRGDLPLLVLTVLEEGPAHGYAIARAIEQLSHGALTAREGSLYPALRGLEQEGWIVASWETPPSGPARKVYTLTETGRAERVNQLARWQEYADALGSVLAGGRKLDVQPT